MVKNARPCKRLKRHEKKKKKDMSSVAGGKYSLEEEIATHSSILAWETPWTEEPGRLQSRVSQSDKPEAT